MDPELRIVLSSSAAVFGLLGFSWLYSRRKRPDLSGTLRVAMDVFVPCLAFTSLMDSRLRPADFAVAAAATGIQIATGLIAGVLLLAVLRRPSRRDLLLPVAFVNSANLPLPLLLANYGADGLSVGVVCFMVTNLALYPAAVLLLHERGSLRAAFREPAVWATIAAGLLRAFGVHLPDAALEAPRIAAAAAVPLMLLIFGDSLARTQASALRLAVPTVAARYLSGLAALAVTLPLLRPEGLVRQVLILYALLPPAMVNVILVRNSGRDEQPTAAAVLLATALAVGILPLILALAP